MLKRLAEGRTEIKREKYAMQAGHTRLYFVLKQYTRSATKISPSKWVHSHTRVVHPPGWLWRAARHRFLTLVYVDLGVEAVCAAAEQDKTALKKLWRSCVQLGRFGAQDETKKPHKKCCTELHGKYETPVFIFPYSFIHHKTKPEHVFMEISEFPTLASKLGIWCAFLQGAARKCST